MSESTRLEKVVEPLYRCLSWSAIIFGTILALALSIMLHVLGLGVTATVADPNSTASQNLVTIGGVSGIWFLLSTAVGLFAGGFVASTLSRTFTGGRAAIYGLGVWALCMIATMSVVVPAIVNGAGTTLNAAGTVTEKAAGALGAAGGMATQAGQNLPSGVAGQVQQLLLGTNAGEADPAAVQSITRLISLRVTQGNWTPQQRDELVNSVARIAKISPDDARRRVEEAQNTLTATLEQTKQSLRQAADAARTAVAAASYWAFAAMLIGAIAALLGARFGLLDETHLPAFARLGSSRARETHA
jgi:hypothetical protein